MIAVEEQAHGHTADLARPLSFEQMADDTAALLEQLHVRDADVLGFSNGGMTALELAVRHPSLVHRLVICSGFYAHAGLIPALRAGVRAAAQRRRDAEGRCATPISPRRRTPICRRSSPRPSR